MIRHTLAFVLVLASQAAVRAQGWATPLFAETAHDFGTVQRGPTLQHDFRITNTTASAVRISAVRVSCGCVTATAAQPVIAPGQSAVINAHMDTRRFMGTKVVTVFVTFDQPQYDEVRLTVSAVGRDDITIEPAAMAFGQTRRGAGSVARANVTLRNPNWQLVSIASDSHFIQATAKPSRGQFGEIVYELTANLRPDTPVGNWHTDLWLKTNDPAAERIRVPVTLTVLDSVTAHPPALALGEVKLGSPVEHKVTIRGVKPFRITDIQGTGDGLEATATFQDARPTHILSVKLGADRAGEVKRKITVVTDLPGTGPVELPVAAKVAEPTVNAGTKE